jgi:protease I
MVAALDGKKVAFLVANEGVEQVELVEPWEAVKKAGGQPVLLAPSTDDVQAFDHLDKADTFHPDLAVAGADVADYEGLVLPGGVANPDQLRTDDASVAFVSSFVASGKPVASICHAAWTLVEAGAVEGRTLTSWPSLRTDITNAGGDWVDEEVVIDANLITSRNPDDLPAFCSALVVAIHDASPSLV